MTKRPAGTTTICGHCGQSWNASPGFRHRGAPATVTGCTQEAASPSSAPQKEPASTATAIDRTWAAPRHHTLKGRLVILQDRVPNSFRTMERDQ